MKYIFVFITIFVMPVFGEEFPIGNSESVFPGRISRINDIAKLLRFKIDFENAKFLIKNDRIEIWNPSSPRKRCLGYLKGRTPEYLLVKVPNIKKCQRSVFFSVGSYLHMYSPNLDNNLKTAKDLVVILTRKRTALDARKSRYEKSISSYVEKLIP